MAWLDVGLVLPVGLALALGLSAQAGVDETLLASGWKEVTFDGKEPNRFAPDMSGGVAVHSAESVSLLQRPLDVDLAATPVLSWRWRVDAEAPPTDLSIKGEDDRSLALYVTFPYVPEDAGVIERMKRAIVENIAGKDAPGRVLMYVWGGQGQRGDRVKSPHLGSSGSITILRPAGTETGSWFEEAVDIADDYRRTFGSEPADPMSIAIGADTDDTRSMAEGFIANPTFVGRSKAF